MKEVIAVARLKKGKSCYLWIIPQCPICGEDHEHGGGSLSGNPDNLLGSRTPHCLNPGEFSYRLVREPEFGDCDSHEHDVTNKKL